MKKAIYLLLVLLTFTSCEEDIIKVGVRIEAEGFNLGEALLDPLGDFPQFTHKLSRGTVTFAGSNSTIEFNTGDVSIEDFLFELPVGEYQLEISIPPASLYGQNGGSFQSDPQLVNISELTGTISIEVTPDCALFLVYDKSEQLEDGIYMIEKYASGNGYFRSYPLSKDSLSGLHYAYFTPDPEPTNPSAYLWFYEGKPGNAVGGLSTTDCEIGFQYKIRVLD